MPIRRPSRPRARLSSIGRRRTGAALWAALILAVSLPGSAGARRVSSVSQTVRWLRLDDGAYWIGYMSVGFRAEKWNLRTGTSYLSWDPDGSPDAPPSRSGVGSIYATLGRRILGTAPEGYGSRGSLWLRARGKVALQREYTVLGSGREDWGISLLARWGTGRAEVSGEIGYLDLGEPEGAAYDPLATGTLAVSYRPRWMRGFLTTGLLAASPSRTGEPGYGEVSFGGGYPVSRKVSVSVIASSGLTTASPNAGVAVQFGWSP